MKKAAKKKPGIRKSVPKKTTAPAAKAVLQTSSGKRRLVTKQPQSKQQAALANGMFLYTDDAWSLRYFDQNDLHYKERIVFG